MKAPSAITRTLKNGNDNMILSGINMKWHTLLKESQFEGIAVSIGMIYAKTLCLCVVKRQRLYPNNGVAG